MWAFPPWVCPCIICVFFPDVYYAHFFPRIKCVFLHVLPTNGFANASVGMQWVCPCILMAQFFPRIKCACVNVGIPTVCLPMHNMRGFSHVYYAHFFPRIKCAFLHMGMPTVGLPMHNMRGHIKRIFPTHKMRMCLCRHSHGVFAHA